jgi:hypothetical protein
MRRFIIAGLAGSLLLLSGLASNAEARWGWRGRPYYNNYYYRSYPRYYGYYSTPRYYSPGYGGYGYYSPGYYSPGYYNYNYSYNYRPGFSIWW